MTSKFLGRALIAASAIGMSWVTACDDPFAQCEEGVGCPPFDESGGSSAGGEAAGGSESPGGGSTSGGAAGSPSVGGKSSGGVAGEGGEASGGAAQLPCGGPCDPSEPICDEESNLCVGCLDHDNCEDPTKPLCTADQECVPCESDSSCEITLGLSERPVCLDGTEDATTGEVRPDTGACAECGRSSDCGGAICDEVTLTCIEGTSYKGKGLCEACTDDRECKDGQLCVEMTYDDPTQGVVGTFCLWRKDADGVAAPKGTCGINSRPYASTQKVTSANGVEVDVCTLRTTTCPALKEHATAVTGCDMEGDDEACGAEEFNDGKCRLDGNSDPKCTYRCGGPEDCDGFTCFDTGSEKYCAL
jgi:hypothetical protein